MVSLLSLNGILMSDLEDDLDDEDWDEDDYDVEVEYRK